MSKTINAYSCQDYSFIWQELTDDMEKNIEMLKGLRERNWENGNLVREIDRWFLIFLPQDRKEGFVSFLYSEIYGLQREALAIISKGLKQVVSEKDIRDDPPETCTGTYGKDRIHLTHTDRRVVLKLSNPDSEFLNFSMDYFRGEPHGFQVSECQGDNTYIYHWEKESIERFRTTPDEIDFLFTFGSALMGHGLYSYAALRFQEILNRDPDDHETLIRLSECLNYMGQYEFAFHYLRRAVSIKPDDERAYLELADCYRELGLYGMALENLLRARALGQGDRRTHNNIGVAYSVMEEYSQAIQAFKKALKLDPDFAMPWRNIGVAYQRLGRFFEAIEAYGKYAELDPQNQEPHLLLGELSEGMGDLSSAAKAYQRAIGVLPNYSAYLSLGRIYEKLNRIFDARESYQEALKLYPADKEVRGQLFRLDHPDMEELEEEMVQVVKDHPFLGDDPDAVPVIYEEAKRRKVEREERELASKQGEERLGLN